jgi:phosphopantothenoylcysteine synthetase/decarboxylase
MDLKDIARDPLMADLLKDEHCQSADFFELGTKSTFWNKAIIVSLDNTNVINKISQYFINLTV